MATQDKSGLVVLDGADGEGGGQILRTALALSIATNTPFRLENVRAGRERPGLARQHVASIAAAARVGSAKVEGAEIGSGEVVFEPSVITPGRYHFDVGSAGSATLVLQTVLPPLLLAKEPSTVVVEGGTHNPFAPPFEFLAKTFAPLVARMGPKVELELDGRGFYPKGGGKITMRIDPSEGGLAPLHLDAPFVLLRRRARAVVEKLARHIAEREILVVARELGFGEHELTIEEHPQAHNPGNYLTIDIDTDVVCEVVSSIGERGLPAEIVATRAALEARRYFERGAPVGEHLADQLMVVLALGGGGSYLTGPLSPHATTNAEVVRRFTGVAVRAGAVANGCVLVEVGAR